MLGQEGKVESFMKKLFRILFLILFTNFISISAFAQETTTSSTGQLRIMPNVILESSSQSATTQPSNLNNNKLNNEIQNKKSENANNNTTENIIDNTKDNNNIKNNENIDIFKNFVSLELRNIFNKPLKQFGYNLFNNKTSSSKPSVTGSYILKKGDKIKAFFWGTTVDLMALSGSSLLQPVSTLGVDAEGNLFVPGAGVIPAEGLSLNDVESKIRSTLKPNYPDFNVKLTVEDPSMYNIFVVGRVKNPGLVPVNSTSTIIDALTSAGGIESMGSLRNIVYINAHSKRKTTIDLYNLITKGDNKKINFKEGDVVMVNSIGKVVAIADGVKNPAIFEFKTGETLKNIVDMAGGLLPSIDPNQIQIEGYDINKKQKVIKDLTYNNLKSIVPKDGDMLTFTPMFNQSENVVALSGNIKHPGKFEFKQGMKLSNILPSRDELLSNTFTYQAFIYRTEGLENSITSIPINLNDFFNGTINPELKAKDIIKIFASNQTLTVDVAGEVKKAGLIPIKTGMKLRDVLGIIELNQLPEKIVVEITNDNNKTNVNTIYLYDLLIKNNEGLNVDLNSGDKLVFRPITEKELVKQITILGQVYRPGVLKFKPGIKLSDAIEQSGGINEDGSLKGLILLRSSVSKEEVKLLNKTILKLQEDITIKSTQVAGLNGEDQNQVNNFIQAQKQLLTILREKADQQYGRIVLNITSNNLAELSAIDNIRLQDDDCIIIPNQPNHVIILGEVYNQSAVVFIPNQRAKYYIDRVGGLTKEAKRNEVFIIRSSGLTESPKKAEKITIEAGDSIIVPKNIKIPGKAWSTLKDVMQLGSQAALTAFMLIRL